MNETRPNPDVLLAAITKEEQRRQRGRLKVFLGMCAGVGKTYAMLQAAAERKTEGVEPRHRLCRDAQARRDRCVAGRARIVPRLTMTYRETVLEEMDTDAILRRKPKLVLVNELAHTNAPGVRHLKRYQDDRRICWRPASTSTPPSMFSTSRAAPMLSARSPVSPCTRRCQTRCSTRRTRWN